MHNKTKIAAFIVLAIGQNAFAFELPKIPAVNAKPTSAAPVADASASQEMVVRKYVAAATDVNQAQIHLAKAFGLKDQAAALEATATALQSGSVDKPAIKKQTELSESVNAEVSKRIAAGEQLSDEGKAEYAKSLMPFGTGVYKASQLGSDLNAFRDAAQQQISSASLIEKAQVTNKLSAGMYLVTSAPGFILNTATSLKQLVTYAQNNKIPVPKDATAAIDM